jgi:hypothetical protein
MPKFAITLSAPPAEPVQHLLQGLLERDDIRRSGRDLILTHFLFRMGPHHASVRQHSPERLALLDASVLPELARMLEEEAEWEAGERALESYLSKLIALRSETPMLPRKPFPVRVPRGAAQPA